MKAAGYEVNRPWSRVKVHDVPELTGTIQIPGCI